MYILKQVKKTSEQEAFSSTADGRSWDGHGVDCRHCRPSGRPCFSVAAAGIGIPPALRYRSEPGLERLDPRLSCTAIDTAQELAFLGPATAATVARAYTPRR
jgi:hypothetical protein